ncbi:unnamed protein product, partial [Mesorhabditis belari]|uniref:Secreted protein n=1 Tax=Mesorhabditis belari TaxID=2138241 RepID=A0AAF3EIC7_9BILA
MLKDVLVCSLLFLGCAVIFVNGQSYGLPPPPSAASYYPPPVQWNPVGYAPSYPTRLRYGGWNKDGYKWPKSSSSSSSSSGSHEHRRRHHKKHHRRHRRSSSPEETM